MLILPNRLNKIRQNKKSAIVEEYNQFFLKKKKDGAAEIY